MTRGEAIKLIERFISERLPDEDWYKQIQNHIKAIVFYGSRAKETNRPDSDVDILIILPLETEKKYTAGEYVFQYEGQEINIVLRSIEKIRKIAKEGASQEEAEPFVQSEIIWESDGEVRNLMGQIL